MSLSVMPCVCVISAVYVCIVTFTNLPITHLPTVSCVLQWGPPPWGLIANIRLLHGALAPEC